MLQNYKNIETTIFRSLLKAANAAETLQIQFSAWYSVQS